MPRQSLLNYLWREKVFDIKRSIEISNKYNIPHVISSVASQYEDYESYLYPTLSKHFISPFKIQNMKIAAEMILEYVSLKKQIVLFGDYDVDGSISTAMLYKYLTSLKAECKYIIPDRMKDGYGPNSAILSSIECDLLIFLDCGTNARAEIDSLPFQVIVIDHHVPHDLCNALIVNPKCENHDIHLSNLCTSGLVLMLIVALNSIATSKIELSEYIGLSAIGTVCDLVPLYGLNRLIVKKGIEVLNKNTKLKFVLGLYNISSYEIAFKIGPILNAGSRMKDSTLATRFLIDLDSKLATELIQLNEERKTIQELNFQDALKKIENKNYILLYSDKWHKGVIGIIASKMVNQFNLPAFIGVKQNNVITFSVRSVEPIDIANIIIAAKNLLLKGGGHKMAGGFSILECNIIEFKALLDQILSETSAFKKTMLYNGNISLYGLENVQQHLSYIEPTGMNNPPLRFQLLNLKINNVSTVKNIKIFEFKNILDEVVKVICFDSNLIKMINRDTRYDLLVSVSERSIILEDAKVIHSYSRSYRDI